MTPAEMRALYERHVAALNGHDLEGIMATFLEGCYVEDLAFGLRVEGKEAVERYYARLLDMFPDAEMTVDEWAFGDDMVVACGRYHVTIPSLFLGFTSTAGAVEITNGVTIITVKDGLVEGERIFLNLAALCDQAGVSLDKVRAAVRALMA